LFFKRRFGPSVKLSYTQAAILLALGLQHKDVGDVERELGPPQSQILAQFNKSVCKVVQRLKEIEHDAIKKEVEVEQGSRQRRSRQRPTRPHSPLLPPLPPAHPPRDRARKAPRTSRSTSRSRASSMPAEMRPAEMKRKQRELLEGLNLEQSVGPARICMVQAFFCFQPDLCLSVLELN